MVREGNSKAEEAAKEIYKAAYKRSTSSKILDGLAKGLAVAMILVSVADIALNVYALYKYYNREHLPVPKRMIDMSTNKAKETSYVTYKTVRDNNGNPGDLNGGESKQWLALYQAKDDRAGQPILAPESGIQMKVVYGGEGKKDNLSPLHMFGQPNVAQNLTYADGEKGFSYNDDKDGTYLYFTRYDGQTVIGEQEKETVSTVSKETTEAGANGNATAVAGTSEDGSKKDGAEEAGTVISGGGIALIASGVVVALGFAFFAINNLRKRKRM